MSKERERIAARVAALKARDAQIAARERAAKRRRRTHAAVVAGALLLDRPEAFGLTAAAVRAALAQAVQRPHDRAALDLDADGAA